MSDEEVRAAERAYQESPGPDTLGALGRVYDRSGITFNIRSLTRTVQADFPRYGRPPGEEPRNPTRAWGHEGSSLEAWVNCPLGSNLMYVLAKHDGASPRTRLAAAACMEVAFYETRFLDPTRSRLANTVTLLRDLYQTPPDPSMKDSDRKNLMRSLDFAQADYDRTSRIATASATADRAGWFATLANSEFARNAQWIPSTISAAIMMLDFAEISNENYPQRYQTILRVEQLQADAIRRVIPIPTR